MSVLDLAPGWAKAAVNAVGEILAGRLQRQRSREARAAALRAAAVKENEGCATERAERELRDAAAARDRDASCR